MTTFRVQEIGSQTSTRVDAFSSMHAVAEVAGCDWKLVGVPIWRRFKGKYDRARGIPPSVECYFPLDNSGRQWLVYRES